MLHCTLYCTRLPRIVRVQGSDGGVRLINDRVSTCGGFPTYCHISTRLCILKHTLQPTSGFFFNFSPNKDLLCQFLKLYTPFLWDMGEHGVNGSEDWRATIVRHLWIYWWETIVHKIWMLPIKEANSPYTFFIRMRFGKHQAKLLKQEWLLEYKYHFPNRTFW